MLAQHVNAAKVLKLNSSQVRAVNTNTIKRCDSQIYAPFKSEAIQHMLDETAASRKEPGRVLFSKGRVVQE
jgi:transketolase C-terminal domain/subunit